MEGFGPYRIPGPPCPHELEASELRAQRDELLELLERNGRRAAAREDGMFYVGLALGVGITVYAFSDQIVAGFRALAKAAELSTPAALTPGG